MQRFHKVLNCVSILIEGRQPELSNHQGQTTTEFLYKKLANFGTSDATKTTSHILGRRRGAIIQSLWVQSIEWMYYGPLWGMYHKIKQ